MCAYEMRLRGSSCVLPCSLPRKNSPPKCFPKNYSANEIPKNHHLCWIWATDNRLFCENASENSRQRARSVCQARAIVGQGRGSAREGSARARARARAGTRARVRDLRHPKSACCLCCVGYIFLNANEMIYIENC